MTPATAVADNVTMAIRTRDELVRQTERKVKARTFYGRRNGAETRTLAASPIVRIL
jgi:hypothetical protein